jgi:hypothetical protein
LTTRLVLPAVLAGLAVAGCGRQAKLTSDLMLVSLTQDEALEDLAEMKGAFKRLYGPYEYKERRFGYRIDDLFKQAESDLRVATSDAQVVGAWQRTIAALHDGHVSLTVPFAVDGVVSYDLPFLVTPVGDKALVGKVDDAAGGLGIARGDEVVAVDGKTPAEILEIAKTYRARGNELSDRHFVSWAAIRPTYAVELQPRSALATVELARPDGTRYTVYPLWSATRTPLAALHPTFDDARVGVAPDVAEVNARAKGTVLEWGAREPWFATDAAKAALGWTEVEPADATLAAVGLQPTTLKPAGKPFAIYAARYDFGGKRVLLMRMPTYSPDLPAEDMLRGFAALIGEFQPQVDVMVLDQTHNPGGSIDYADAFFRLFADRRADNLVQTSNADRKWIGELLSWSDEATKAGETAQAAAWKYQATRVEAAIGRGASLTEPMPLVGGPTVDAFPGLPTWKKPVLLLTDELAGSCGDIVPMLFQRNARAKTFGQRTMGLGGNVEAVVTLTNSRTEVRLTRGLFTTYREDGAYDDAQMIENNGVPADLPYAVAVDDFRAGFVGYVEAFSAAAVAAP